MNKVTLCFITCDMHEHAKDCWEALCNYSEGNEIIALKNGCNPDYLIGENIFQTSNRVGIAIARNLCLERATNDIIIWMDDDILPLEPFINPFLIPFMDKQVGIVGYDGWAISDDDLWRCWAVDTRMATPDYFDSPYAIRMDMIQDIGGYDERFSTWGGDNTDLHIRAKFHGWQLCSIQAPALIHWRESTRKTLIDANQAGKWEDTIEILKKKHPCGWRNKYGLPKELEFNETIQLKPGYQKKVDDRYRLK